MILKRLEAKTLSEINVMEIVAGLMALSARTAPKGGGRILSS